MGHKALIASHLAMVNRVGSKILSTPNMHDLYTEIIEIIQKEFNFYHISLWAYDEKAKESILRAKGGTPDYRFDVGQHVSIDVGITGWALKRGKTVYADDVTKDPRYYAYPGHHTQSELCAVMRFQGKTLGALNIESDKLNAFDNGDIVMLETIADMCALALHSRQLYDVVEAKVEEKTKQLKEAQSLLEKENNSLKSFINQKIPSIKIIGSSKPLKQLLHMVDRIAPTTVTVLIQGESGTGKELIAKRLHDKSQRSHGPYVTINCSALNENLLKSELFGHEKGAFTGAHALKQGLVEVAHGGTLFMDEIAEMGPGIQAKLLRFLQEGEFYRVGGKRVLKVNVRIISATNKDLENEVKEGRFREDLFYRLNTITLRVPPLRKRIEDLDSLVDYFLKADLWGESKVNSIEPDALALFKQYDWPGNIRELQNVIERLKILSEGLSIGVQDVKDHFKFPTSTSAKGEELTTSIVALQDLEKAHILKTLTCFHGNKTKAANALGITIKTLYNKLNRYEHLTRH